MGIVHGCRQRLQLSVTHRAWAIAAAVINALYAGLAVADGFNPVVWVLAVGLPPALLLALLRFPRTFRVLAGVLGALYLAIAATAALFVGALLAFGLSGALLLAAALVPRTART